MRPTSRRGFLTGALLGAAALGATGTATAAAPQLLRRDVTEIEARAVVIGSGLGGSIAAARLAEAGVPTLVLERGRRWPTPATDTFPTFLRPDRRSSWLTPAPVFPGQPPTLYRPYTGLFEKVGGRGMSVLCGAGVGGSTLVYAGVWIKPEAAVFSAAIPGIDHDELAADHYPRAARRVGVSPIPDDVLAHPAHVGTRLFLEQARRAGHRAELLPNATDWDVVRDELAGRATPSMSVGEYFSGVNSGARRSSDKNYLRDAEASGLVEVAPLNRVVDIHALAGGRYRIDVERIDTDGVVRERIAVTSRAVFLGAGSTGTSRLLVRARETGTLPDLTPDAGRYWGNNGDRIQLRAGVPDPAGGPQAGPMAAGIRPATDDRAEAVTLTFGPAPLPFDARVMSLPGFGACDPVGEFRFDAATGDAPLHWAPDGDADAQRTVRDLTRQLIAPDNPAGAGLGQLVSDVAGRLPDGLSGLAARAADAPGGVVDLGTLDPITWHPLGGAVLGKVTDDRGRVEGHPGLHVVDGAWTGSWRATRSERSAHPERGQDDGVDVVPQVGGTGHPARPTRQRRREHRPGEQVLQPPRGRRLRDQLPTPDRTDDDRAQCRDLGQQPGRERTEQGRVVLPGPGDAEHERHVHRRPLGQHVRDRVQVTGERPGVDRADRDPAARRDRVHHQRRLVAPLPVQRRLAGAGRGGDRLDGRLLEPPLGDEPPGRGEHLPPPVRGEPAGHSRRR
ncbi:putative cholesterol oxidase [Pseudonocardia sp. Ae168_Ps1]|nr:GMC family oxidoreductase N-terminal domain-containing protein [Pseudonocardia sp. Ae168_Ps1]OLL72684.1 putative cholesterol oxidase [Pseudonocardia sp. Ae150A_Ps1]OLL78655.1 putative cholesterol oxidase [Pseudonocardia sp. Ae168_Ps1]OLL87216.1 putative cholesterol oxidase [Pseudonocardia sp. Ae263_Ps1]OLL92754.1 putative cholesterol oxidase [Pseudonocardia sp. Ae356_Ps1]